MEKSKKLNLVGQLLLIITAFLWGSGFVVMKETVEKVPTFYLIALRFVIGGVLLLLIFCGQLKYMTKKAFLHGIILGLCLAFAYVFQTIGLKFTSPAQNAFLTSAYTIILPFLAWIMFRRKPESHNLVSAIICTIGLALIAFSNGFGGGSNAILGDGLTFLCAIGFAFQILFIDKFQKDNDNQFCVLVVELLTVGVVNIILSLIFELPKGVEIYAIDSSRIWHLVFLTLGCTVATQLFQIVGQKYTTPSQTSIIFSLESIFGAVFSIIYGYENLSALLIIGFVVVFASILICELKIDIFKPFSKKKNQK